MRAACAASRTAALALALATAAAPARAAGGLEPYQLVRSLQLVQDRMAGGDHAALPMQRKILEMIDARLLESEPEELSEGRNFRALMIYAMSGGNPGTIEKVVSSLILDDEYARLGAGLIQYTKGEHARASAALKEIEPADVPDDLGSVLALVKGTLLINHEPERSLKYFDYARLSGPGTLIEEAALRRALPLAVEVKDPARFVRNSEQYVRRFLRSPYASQFADAFIAGVVGLHDAIDLQQVVTIIAGMTPEQGKVIYLRIARQAAIERMSSLLAFARKGLETYMTGAAEDDPRAALYAALAAVTSEDIVDVREQLDKIDRSQLSASDRALLDAARGIVEEVMAVPRTSSIAPQEAAAEEAVTALPVSGPLAGGHATASADAEAEKATVHPEASTSADAEPAKTAAEPLAQPDPSQDFINDTRRRLEAVDKLLQETGS
jgi:chemotaxis protein MotC